MDYCSSFLKQDSFFIASLLTGLIGGFTHCLSMCGSFMACNPMCHSTNCSNKGNLIHSLYAQIPYHLGRATTYGFLGFFAALLSKQIAAWHFWPYLSATMLVIAGIIFIINSLPNCSHFIANKFNNMNYFSGLSLGFMPCGLIYALLMVAATTANPVKAMLGMWVFVFGTIPALLVISIGTATLKLQWQNMVGKIGRSLMTLNGLMLLVMAAKLIR